MPLRFYPYPEDAQKGSLEERIEVLRDAAEQYKALILDAPVKTTDDAEKKRAVPRDQAAAFNWEEIARVLREIRDLPEGSTPDKNKKGKLLNKLAEVYEVLRGARMAKLEAVRLALINEANQLLGGGATTQTV